jgi:hypothetical protein
LADLKKSSPLKPLGQMNQHLVGSIYGRFSLKIAYFVPIRNQKQELPVAAMFVNGSELNEHSLYRTFQGCFLPSFDPFGQVVSEETIFLEINLLKPLGQMSRNLVGNIYIMSSIKIAPFVPIR